MRALAEQLSVNPFSISLEILKSQHLPALPGEPGKKGRLVTTAEYIKVLTEIQPYLAGKIAITALTGADGGPVAVQSMSLMQIMSDPLLASAAQTLALGLVQRPQLESGSNPDDTDEQQPFPECGVHPKRRTT